MKRLELRTPKRKKVVLELSRQELFTLMIAMHRDNSQRGSLKNYRELDDWLCKRWDKLPDASLCDNSDKHNIFKMLQKQYKANFMKKAR